MGPNTGAYGSVISKRPAEDTEGRTFIGFALEEIQIILSRGHDKAVRPLAELEWYASIERVKQGWGKLKNLCEKGQRQMQTMETMIGPQKQPTPWSRKLY